MTKRERLESMVEGIGNLSTVAQKMRLRTLLLLLVAAVPDVALAELELDEPEPEVETDQEPEPDPVERVERTPENMNRKQRKRAGVESDPNAGGGDPNAGGGDPNAGGGGGDDLKVQI